MIDKELLNSMLLGTDQRAWEAIEETLFNVFTPPFEQSPVQEILKREGKISGLEALIAGAGWDLWHSFETNVSKTSELLIKFWEENHDGKAVFIIDGLSLREMPFFLTESQKRGYTIHQSKITASALPSDTTYFAKKLGFSQRSSLENNSAGLNHFFTGAKTELSDMPWKDCISLIGNDPNLIFWHTAFDDRIHEYKVPGKGLRELSLKSSEYFTSEGFWELIEKASLGRRVIITSDHGYASTGEFTNISGEQGDYLKETYKSQRYTKNKERRPMKSIPPIEIQMENSQGLFSYVLGRRRWKNSGGYPTLAHGGLSLMETMVPFIEITK
ncbi:hypothetical protein SAMN04487975_101378 [Planococcus glaciei]|uniref:hypothetical protein n=1 Tax=Planococcus glaciei TaxID=459472 RepID=UPI00088D79A8|nr:hypothetical protein [Planococcus glaciei]SDG75056.1 hypothetical protein SAMN04487975_101378 [Planococcus glaciei]